MTEGSAGARQSRATADGRVAVITGGTSGIGLAVARACAAAGYVIVIVSRRGDISPWTSAEGADPTVVVGDLADDDQTERVCSELESLEQVALLVHSAGAFSRASVADANPADLDRLFRLNVRAPFRLTQALLPGLRAARGDVVFVNSSVLAGGAAFLSHYAITKSALQAFAGSLRLEENRHGVRVLSVFPGRTATAMQAEVHRLEGRVYSPEALMRPEDVAQTIMTALSVPRSAEITDVHVRPMLPPNDFANEPRETDAL